MKISVVTPVLNGERFIRQTIESVLSQQGDFETEYIIKDAVSTDNTLCILNEYKDCPNVKLVSQKDRSLFDAINQGFQYATGDIGCWINGDDYYEQGTFQAIVDTFKAHPTCQWLYGDCNIVDENNLEIRQLITWYKKLVGYRFSLRQLLCENYINQPSCFWRMELWRRVGGLNSDYKYAADYALWLKMTNHASAPIKINKTLANFRRCGTSVSDKYYVQQFHEEYLISKPYSGPLTKCLHFLNIHRTIFIYRVLQHISL